MRSILLIALFLCLILTPRQTFAQGELDTEVINGKLANGLRYVIVKDSERPGLAEFYFAVGAGNLQEQRGQVAYAHLVEHLLISEVKDDKFPDIKGRSVLQIWQGKNPISPNAHTGNNSAMVVLPIDLSVVSEVQPLIAFRSYFGFSHSEDAVRQEGAAVINEGRLFGDVLFDLYDRLEKSAPRMPYSPSDSKNSMSHISMARLKAFHAAWYRPDLSYIFVRGDVDPKSTEVLIRRIFAEVKRPDSRPEVTVPVARPSFALALARSDKLDKTTIKVQFQERPSFAERRSLFDDAEIRQGVASVLNARLRPLTRNYDALMEEASIGIVKGVNGEGWEIELRAMNCKPDSTADCINQVMDIFQSSVQNPFTPAEVEIVRRVTPPQSSDFSRASWGESMRTRAFELNEEYRIDRNNIESRSISEAIKMHWANSTVRIEIMAPSSGNIPEKMALRDMVASTRRIGKLLAPGADTGKELSLSSIPIIDDREIAVTWRPYGDIDVAKVSAPALGEISVAFARPRERGDYAGFRISARSSRGIVDLAPNLQASALQVTRLADLSGLGGLDRFQLEDYNSANGTFSSISTLPFGTILTVGAPDGTQESVEKVAKLLAAIFEFKPDPRAAAVFSRNWVLVRDDLALIPAGLAEPGLTMSRQAENVMIAYRNLLSNPADFVFEVSGIATEDRERIARMLGSYLLRGGKRSDIFRRGEVIIPPDIRESGFEDLQVNVNWAIIEKDGRDYDKVDQALSHILSKRLFRKIREEMKVAYSILFSASNLSSPRLFLANARFNSEESRVDEAVGAITSLFSDFAERGPTVDELNEIRALPPINPLRTSVEQYIETDGAAPPAMVVEPTVEELMNRAKTLTRGNAQIVTSSSQ